MKNSFILNCFVISVFSQEEKREYIEFRISNFTNKIGKLTSYLELHKKTKSANFFY